MPQVERGISTYTISKESSDQYDIINKSNNSLHGEQSIILVSQCMLGPLLMLMVPTGQAHMFNPHPKNSSLFLQPPYPKNKQYTTAASIDVVLNQTIKRFPKKGKTQNYTCFYTLLVTCLSTV